MAEKTYIVTESWVRKVEAAIAKLNRITGDGIANTPDGVSVAPPAPPKVMPRIPVPVMCVIDSNATKKATYYAKMGRWNGRIFDPTNAAIEPIAYYTFSSVVDAVVINYFEAGLNGHLLTEGTYSMGWLRGAASDGKFLVETWKIPAPIFLVALEESGSAASLDGAANAYAAWQYDLFSPDGVTQNGTDVSIQGGFPRRTKGATGVPGQAIYGIATTGEEIGASGSGPPALIHTFEQITHDW